MITYIIDLNKIYDKKSLYIYLKEVFCDCEFYGSNLDALLEVLMSLNNVNVKIIYNKKVLYESLGEYSVSLIECFNIVKKDNKKINVIIEEV